MIWVIWGICVCDFGIDVVDIEVVVFCVNVLGVVFFV